MRKLLFSVAIVFGLGHSWLLADAPDLPDLEVVEAYTKAAEQNVIASLNDELFPGYFSVCADGRGYGYGNSYPSLDGNQLTEALVWVGKSTQAKQNWDYIRKFQKPDGQLPLAIRPGAAVKGVGYDQNKSQEANGGLYVHWVPGDPLRALAAPSYIQNADAIFRATQDLDWLKENIQSVNLCADHCIKTLITKEGAVGGAGYYLERPVRKEYDGVAQGSVAHALKKLAELNEVAGDDASAKKYQEVVERITSYFQTNFWIPEQNQFAEYIHPKRGKVFHHGLSDTDWTAIAFDMASAEQTKALWPKLKQAQSDFHYGGMPTGIVTQPKKFEDWEFTVKDTKDLAAMGRVWYLEAVAHAQMNDAVGLLQSIQAVCKVGKAGNYYWRERYFPKGKGGVTPGGAQKYNEYPANLIRIVNRYLLGIDIGLDGSLTLAPVVPEDWWVKGFGHKVTWGKNSLAFRFDRELWRAEVSSPTELKLRVKLPPNCDASQIQVKAGDTALSSVTKDGSLVFEVPESLEPQIVSFKIPPKTEN